ncbi:Fe(2+) transporter permease subunit FeoB [Stenoxybacter acetivorans]|uniref:Fe(2+) transporter permease subunit FeoB n=1 Tax=Stenoxybacter acetivorans TaxID=422441 RepID=UPI000569F28B|nr:Fe(2+) transporter permease subunit FeoB [Stenoxybacter acetivorans]
MSQYVISLIGNPNSGKTTLFNALTGARQRVGNWPGVTVERVSGHYHLGDHTFEVVDLPGTYSLDVADQEVSLDEKVARDYVHTKEADLVINIIDAANLERNLYLTTQLAEMNVPLLVALNMNDVAESKGIKVDAAALSAKLGCPVVPIVAASKIGIDDLKKAILQAAANPQPSTLVVRYNEHLESAIAALQPQMTEAAEKQGIAPRWLTVRLLEGDDLAMKLAPTPEVVQQAEVLAEKLIDDMDIMVADARYTLANTIAAETAQRSGKAMTDLTGRIDRVVLNRVLGIPIFLLMMYLMFMFTIRIGGAFIDFFDQFFGALLVDGLGQWLDSIGSPVWLTTLIANGIGGGIQTVATFIPVIGFLYLFLAILEDSGYMARAAFVMDRFMRWVGLPGKSFVPLIVGFGCNVPAIMATRTLEHRRDRLMTIAMAPFMSCGARLPVYVLFAAAFFPNNAQNVVFGLYLIGILAAIITGLVLKNTLLQGKASPFIMELPPYHLPTLRGIFIHAWMRLKSFIIRAGRVIVPMVVVLSFLNAIGTDGSYGNEDSDKSVLSAIGRTITPLFKPMGLQEDNWPASVGIFTGILAKEAVIGTLNATYSALGSGSGDEEESEFSVGEAVKEAFATIPANLSDALGAWTDPLGLSAAEDVDQEAFAEEQEISNSIFGAMVERFDGSAGAFAYLLFILLYAPCTAAIAAVYQESGTRWAVFVVLWTTGLGYCVAGLYYQFAKLSENPSNAGMWISILLAVLAAGFMWLRHLGKNADSLLEQTPSKKSASSGCCH